MSPYLSPLGRHRIGPRKLHGPEGLWYAILRHNGKTYRESLKTRDHGLALKRWPPAFQRLKDRANGTHIPTPPAPDEVGLVTNDRGEWVEARATEVFDPEELELTWDQAFSIHNRRQQERRGRPMAAGSIESQRLVRQALGKTPATFTITDVQRYVQQLRDQGLSPATIGQRHGMARAVVQTLLKQGYIESNVWDRVDCSYKQTNHIHTASSAELRAIWDTGDWWLRCLMFTGLRVSELLSRRPEDLDGRWMKIDEHEGFRLKNLNSIREVWLPEWSTELPTKAPHATTLFHRIKRVAPECSVHSLRHSFRTALRSAHVITECSEACLGHAHKGQVGTYGVFTREQIRDAQEAAWRVLEGWLEQA